MNVWHLKYILLIIIGDCKISIEKKWNEKITLITDTNASLPGNIIDKFEIIQVPINIQFAEEIFITGVNIDDSELFRMINERKVIPTTAAPAPSAFMNAYQIALDHGVEQILCICCSGEVSGTYNSAVITKEDFPYIDIHVIDSRGLSLAEGFQVLAVAEGIEAGKDINQILTDIANLRNNTVVYGCTKML